MNIISKLSTTEPINYAQINFNEKQEPHSTTFNDVYFSDCGGINETLHVFIKGNFLEERLVNFSKKEFTIGETGFGTGLNFLTLMNFYSSLNKKLNTNQQLPHINFISVEKYPLSIEDMYISHKNFSQLSTESNELLSIYKNLHSGLNTFKVNKNFTLYLAIGDIAECFSYISLSSPVDAWFLDGFNPEINDDMWSLDNMKLLYKLSAQGTTLATFSVARKVKDRLKESGFNLKKLKGFARKREMLSGYI
ncbi:MAG: tRNA (5-methylaminomethyl-2-thiouridine)(34)-methyltransferase MnmD [Succinivibrionaceae bacterium]